MTKEDLAMIGLKADYEFREVNIPLTNGGNTYQDCLLKVVSPIVQFLENQNLINGFHFIKHEMLDLRLSCKDWSKNENEICDVLVNRSVLNKPKPWSLEPAVKYGGQLGQLLCYNNLEYNSRLCLAVAVLNAKITDKCFRVTQDKLYPSQWVHYLLIQYGMDNIDEIDFHIKDALSWMQTVRERYPRKEYLLKEIAAKAEQKFNYFRSPPKN